MNLLISAGEASGDLHGSRLLAALQRRPARCCGPSGWAARDCEAAGSRRIVSSDALAVFGVAEVLEKLPGPAPRARARWTRRRGGSRPRPPSSSTFRTSTDCSRGGCGGAACPSSTTSRRRSGPGARYRARRIARDAPPHHHALSLRGRDLPKLRGGRGLRRPSAGRGRPRGSRTSRRRFPRRPAGGWCSCPAAGSSSCARHWEVLTDAAAARSRAALRPRGRRGPRAGAPATPRTPAPPSAESASSPPACTRSWRPPTSRSSPRAPRPSRRRSAARRWSSFYRTSGFSWAIARTPRAPALGLARQHRGGGGDRPRADPGRPHGGGPGRGRRRPALGSRAGIAAMRAGLARVADALGPPGASARAAALVLSAVETHP